MRTKLVAGNWKLNGCRADNEKLVQGIVAGLAGLDACDIMVCPPYVYMDQVAGLLRGRRVQLGGQDVARESAGAFTGEVSASMLRDVGCSHVIVGHSERRAMFGDTDEIVAAKFAAAGGESLVPILCVGESREERESGATMQIVERQLSMVLDAVGIESFAAAIVAYEPVWAIGTGLTATPEEAQEVHARIRAIVAARDAKIAGNLRILYGGSVKGSNAPELFAGDDIDGGLIGGASLDADEFMAICRAAAGTE